jgi:hypothetical protein
LAALKGFRDAGVVVLANHKADFELLPAGAKAAHKEAGEEIPMVLVSTADGSTSLRGIPCEKLKEGIREAVRDLREYLETVNVI